MSPSNQGPALDLDNSLPDWLIDFPPALTVFERWGLDHSCGGKSLDYACRERGIDPRRVLHELQQLQYERSGADSTPTRPNE